MTIAWKNNIVQRLTKEVSGQPEEHGGRHVEGPAHIRDGQAVDMKTTDGTHRIRCEAFVIATGSSLLELPDLPALGGDVVTSTEALNFTDLPEYLVVVGASYIGLKSGTAFAKLGSSVTIVKAADRFRA